MFFLQAKVLKSDDPLGDAFLIISTSFSQRSMNHTSIVWEDRWRGILQHPWASASVVVQRQVWISIAVNRLFMSQLVIQDLQSRQVMCGVILAECVRCWPTIWSNSYEWLFLQQMTLTTAEGTRCLLEGRRWFDERPTYFDPSIHPFILFYPCPHSFIHSFMLTLTPIEQWFSKSSTSSSGGKPRTKCMNCTCQSGWIHLQSITLFFFRHLDTIRNFHMQYISNRYWSAFFPPTFMSS